MFKVLIVDDEPFVRQNIIARLLRSGQPALVVGEAEDAPMAYRLYDLHLPEIVFVDINMPGVDGLEMIGEIRRTHPGQKSRFIVISGYDDFKHLQQAIRIGVDNYIHKPIAQEEFEQVLQKEVQRLEEERLQEWEARPVGKEYPYDVAEGWMLEAGDFLLFHAADDRRLSRTALQKAGLFPEGETVDCYSFRASAGTLLLLRHRERPTPLDALRLEAEALSQALSVQVVYGNFRQESLEHLALRAEHFLQLRFLKGNRPKQVIACSPEPELKPASFERKSFETMLERGHIGPAVSWLQQLPALNQPTRENLLFSRQAFYFLLLEVINQYARWGMEPLEELHQEGELFASGRFASLEAMRDRLIALVQKYGESYRRQNGADDLAERARRYLERHYAEEISLQQMANELFVSSAYLSARFKSKTGKTMVQYLEDVRMKKAAEYLQLGKLSVSEVAELVGYHDASYFTRVFRKRYGKSPRDFREEAR